MLVAVPSHRWEEAKTALGEFSDRELWVGSLYDNIEDAENAVTAKGIGGLAGKRIVCLFENKAGHVSNKCMWVHSFTCFWSGDFVCFHFVAFVAFAVFCVLCPCAHVCLILCCFWSFSWVRGACASV